MERIRFPSLVSDVRSDPKPPGALSPSGRCWDQRSVCLAVVWTAVLRAEQLPSQLGPSWRHCFLVYPAILLLSLMEGPSGI